VPGEVTATYANLPDISIVADKTPKMCMNFVEIPAMS
jgi:hypothetical protein